MESAKRRRTVRAVPIIEWSALPQELFLDIASHWDVVTLVEKKRVSRDWKQRCTDAIDAKRTESSKKAFSTNGELRDAVAQYCGYKEVTTDAEEIGTTYGWPINKWDVSILQDFSHIFNSNRGFNEDIGSWNISNATSMRQMFFMATTFNQDLSSWDVSNVRDMSWMFKYAVRCRRGSLAMWQT
jgi:surface protein